MLVSMVTSLGIWLAQPANCRRLGIWYTGRSLSVTVLCSDHRGFVVFCTTTLPKRNICARCSFPRCSAANSALPRAGGQEQPGDKKRAQGKSSHNGRIASLVYHYDRKCQN